MTASVGFCGNEGTHYCRILAIEAKQDNGLSIGNYSGFFHTLSVCGCPLASFTDVYREVFSCGLVRRALGRNRSYFALREPTFATTAAPAPYFDFDAPVRDDVPDHRDVFAAAIVASALLELYRYAPETHADALLDFALSSLRSLSSDSYRTTSGENGHFLLVHGVGNYPNGEEVDAGINYADYYLEALLRCKALT